MLELNFEAIVIILVALAFDFVNGFHDAANSIATVVSTRVLPPRLAVAWAAFWNFVAFLVFGTAVASTIGKGTIDISLITSREAGLNLVLAALIGAIGTLSGGWRIVHTLGSKITKLQPVGGFAAETAAAATLFTTASLGIPVSTTHTITGAVIGVGATNRFSAVRWGLTGRVLYAWVVTIPGSALIAVTSYFVLQVVPATMVGVIGLAAALSWGLLFLLRRRRETQAAVFAPPR